MTRIKTMGKKEKKRAAENKRQVKTGVILSRRLLYIINLPETKTQE